LRVKWRNRDIHRQGVYVKKTDLEKLKGLKIESQVGKTVKSSGFGRNEVAPLNRREQRKLDQAQGLVPFACKLDGELVKQLQALAQQRGTGLGEVVAELLKKGLAKK
jgi:hypothetical protein